jgi:DNA processing protein
MNNLEALVLLNSVRSIPAGRLKKLIDACGSPEKVLLAKKHDWGACGALTPLMVAQLERARTVFDPEKELRLAEKNRVRVVTLFDQEYPENLKQIFDPPVILYVKGIFLPADVNAIGVVGSRGATPYGLECARNFSLKLASFGLTIVSGMARGVDTAAHRGALDAGGRTIAVLGSGLLEIYPPENEKLFFEIAQMGAVISEFPLTTAPLPANFPVRNRIISGLSKGILVVEANQRSGALITARCALEQNREVFAIPGKLTSQTSLGTNDLIKQGARMVTEPEEIVEDLRPLLTLDPLMKTSRQDISTRPSASLSAEENAVVGCLDDEPKHIDILVSQVRLDAARLLAILTQLELKGAVKQLPGKQFILTSMR